MRTRLLAAVVALAAISLPVGAGDDKAPATSGGPTPVAASASGDPAPQDAIPDPLTPAAVETGPVAAPGAATRPAGQSASAAGNADSLIAGVREVLAAWPDTRDAAERADLDAMRKHYADSGAALLWVSRQGLTPRALAAVAALRRADDFGLEAAAFTVPPPPAVDAAPAVLADTEVRLGLAVLKYARYARGGRLDPPALSKMVDMRPRLFEPGSLLAALEAAPAADAYLEGLHPRHPGFAQLREALAKVRAGSGPEEVEAKGAKAKAAGADLTRRIVVNMERWRWLPDDLGPFYVWDNVPEQITRVVHDGKVVLKERIVVGKPNTPTPMFSAPMRFVIFHPSWGVPEGIKSNELGPMLRRAQANSSSWLFGPSDGASRVLRRHELRVFHGGREVDPDRVNWSAVDVRQFQFTQPPSAKNVLGVVKFRFPNKFDVYMHDTSERHLFQRGQRTFSHGCMRVENPLRLAETILAYDKGWGREKVASLVDRSGTTDVTLDKSVPVHIVYFTASVDETGKLHSHADVYGMDNRVASALAGKPVAIASARTEAEPQKSETGGTKEARQKRVSQRAPAGSGQARAAERFDPFPRLSGN